MTTFRKPTAALSLGNRNGPELPPLWNKLCDWTPDTSWQSVESATGFFRHRRSRELTDSWELVVVWQSWSDEYSPVEIQALLTALPLARIVCVTGPWCESDQRTRRLWPAGFVAPWWRAARRMWCELTGLERGDAPPWTASREEVWLWEETLLTHTQGDADSRYSPPTIVLEPVSP